MSFTRLTLYRCVTYWPHREQPTVWTGTAEDLKVYLEREVLCLKHNCPIPNEFEVYRVNKCPR